MEGSLRITLILISAVIIIAIFIHGYWTIRKEKKANELKLKQDLAKFDESGLDKDGFDQSGVGQVKIVGANPLHIKSSLNQNELQAEHSKSLAQALDENIVSDVLEEKEPTINFGVLPSETEDLPAHLLQDELLATPEYSPPSDLASQTGIEKETSSLNSDSVKSQKADDVADDVAKETPVYQQPVINAKPEYRGQTVAQKKATERNTAEKMKRHQMEIDFDDMPSISATKDSKSEKLASTSTSTSTRTSTRNKEINQQQSTDVEQQVIIVSVCMPEGELISGATLLPTLLTLGMKFGDMNIFHRHQNNAGHGEITFSLANMMNPGTFDLDEMENFYTQGVSLFMTLPNVGDAFEVFEQMLKAAKQLAVEFNGQLLDDKRSVMTKQTEQHYVSRIREFERKSRIASF